MSTSRSRSSILRYGMLLFARNVESEVCTYLVIWNQNNTSTRLSADHFALYQSGSLRQSGRIAIILASFHAFFFYSRKISCERVIEMLNLVTNDYFEALMSSHDCMNAFRRLRLKFAFYRGILFPDTHLFLHISRYCTPDKHRMCSLLFVTLRDINESIGDSRQ